MGGVGSPLTPTVPISYGCPLPQRHAASPRVTHPGLAPLPQMDPVSAGLQSSAAEVSLGRRQCSWGGRPRWWCDSPEQVSGTGLLSGREGSQTFADCCRQLTSYESPPLPTPLMTFEKPRTVGALTKFPHLCSKQGTTVRSAHMFLAAP